LSGFDRAVVPALGSPPRLMFCMMLLTPASTSSAAIFFNKPVTGGFELTEMLLAVLHLRGLPAGDAARRSHHRGSVRRR